MRLEEDHVVSALPLHGSHDPPCHDTVIVDLCGTIVAANTTIAFLAYPPLPPGRRLLRSLLRRTPPRVQVWLLGPALRRRLILKLLTGLPKSVLRQAASEMTADLLRTSGAPTVLAELRAAKVGGRTVYLATASLDIIAEAFADHLSLDGFISSELSYDRFERCQGVLKVDATGRKLELLTRKYPGLSKRFRVITDNIEDQDLIQASVSHIFIQH